MSSSRPLCHIIPLWDAHADRDTVRAPRKAARLTKDGMDAWLDKANLLPGQGWELAIRKAVCGGYNLLINKSR